MFAAGTSMFLKHIMFLSFSVSVTDKHCVLIELPWIERHAEIQHRYYKLFGESKDILRYQRCLKASDAVFLQRQRLFAIAEILRESLFPTLPAHSKFA